MSKRLFQVLDEMNVNDDVNKTETCACCLDMVEAKTAKGGGHVIMGVPAEAITKLFFGEIQPILILMDKKEYHRLKDLPIAMSAAEQRIDDLSEIIIDNLDFMAEAKGQISDEDIISQIRIGLTKLLEALTPKTSSDE